MAAAEGVPTASGLPVRHARRSPLAWLRALPPPPGLPQAVAELRGEPVRQALDRLGSLARLGHAQAAYDAYELAQFCAVSGDFDRGLVMLPADTDRNLRDRLQAQAARDARLCDGTTPAQLGERFAEIRIAADGGVKGAAERLLDAQLAAQGPSVDASDPVSGAAMRRALELVHRDALAGDVDALAALASLYQSGGIVAQDAAQALLFQSAALEIMKSQPQAYSVPEIELEQQFVSNDESLVPGESRDAIRKAALELAAGCCRAAIP